MATGAAAEAWAADCTDGAITYVPIADPPAVSVLFDDFRATVDDPTATCSEPVPLTPPDGPGNLPPGVIAVYSADYRGYLEANSIGRMVVQNNGRTETVVLQTADDFLDDYFFRGYAGSNAAGTGIESSIELNLLDYADLGAEFLVDTIDYAELARATTDDLQTSVDDLATGRTALVTHLNATLDLLTGAGRPFDESDGIDFVGGVGSVTLGLHGRMALWDGFSVRGGAAFIDQQAGGASATGGLAAAALRFVSPDDAPLRPFAEAGLKAAPALGLRFTRSYETEVGGDPVTNTVTGSTTSAFLGAYVTGGLLVAPNPSNEIVFSATLARDALATAAYDENFSDSNLFAASVPAQLGIFDTVKVGTAWTVRPTEALALTLSGAIGQTAARNPLATSVAFAGDFSGSAASEVFVQYGARAGYQLTSDSSVGVFVHAATGAVSGTHAQFGGDFHVRF